MRVKLLFFLLLITACFCSAAYAQEQEEDYDYDHAESKATHIYDTSHLLFNWRYHTQPFSQEQIPAGVTTQKKVNTLKKEEDFWYVSATEQAVATIDSAMERKRKGNAPPPEIDMQTSNSSGSSGNLIFILAAVIFIAAVLYFLVSNKVAFFAPRNVAGEDDNISINEIGDNIFALKYNELLQKALKDQDYRLAVRILYLKTLRQLSDKGLIRFQPEYTNIDYLVQLRGGGNYDEFARITRHYEYVWYGRFEVSRDLYERISQDFITVQNKLG
ncbi:DUF4129 domain-containing protein [Filimonas effusa]|uniref:DUF4129 domain-containing protein n=1 Tax=Filimonas effusa TaxID=2508721 RepID=A0A4Q1DAC9_9BACT|nr:DUF4129 domain-containing protein [Filimonas effusa]RXK86337.1 DUF4129 domain-containing protein [Filimonas effusa]